MSQVDLDQEGLDEEIQNRDEAKRGFVERGTRLLREADDLKEDFKSLVEEAKKAGFIPKEIKELIKHNFKNQLNPEIEGLERVKRELDRLFGEY